MLQKRAKETVQDLLSKADVKIGGRRAWDMQVHDDRLYVRLLSGGSMALGESYMDGWWDAKKPDEFITRLLLAELNKKVVSPKNVANIIQSKKRPRYMLGLMTSLMAD